jgi:tRNA G46 methylase TrmB
VRRFAIEKIRPPRQGATLPWRAEDGPPPLLDLEIGCGVGWHALSYVQKHPERHLLAVERTAGKFQSFQRRLERHPPLPNLTAIHADVVPWLVHTLPDACLSRIFILYPNPYPKNRAARFFTMPFFGELLKKARPELHLHLATNEKFYQEEALFMAQSHWGLRLQSQQILSRETFPKPRTHFEKKYLERNEICYDLVFTRAEGQL